MSSEQEEGTDHLDDPNVKSCAADGDISLVKKDNGHEHAKPKRRRRGKKRKHRKESAATCENENHDECESELHAESEHENHAEGDSPTWDSDEDLSLDNAFTDVMIRPVNVPKAPENSTQFIMDDHNECRLYMSFETPNPYLADPPNLDGEGGVIMEPVGEDAAYRDIDYEYESPQDFDNSAYYDREFEQSYKNNRFEELMRLSRSELISALQALEIRLKELGDDLVKENPSPTLEKLQRELLELQEKHSFLKECNSKLTALVMQNETECSVHDLSLEESPGNLSPTAGESRPHGDDTDKEDVGSSELDLCDEPMTGAFTGEPMSDSDSDVSNEVHSTSYYSCDESYDEYNDAVDGRQYHIQAASECDFPQSYKSSSHEHISELEQSTLNDSNCDGKHCHLKIPISNTIVSLCNSPVNSANTVFHFAKQTKCSDVLTCDTEVSLAETN